MYYVYILRSVGHNTRYVGSAEDFEKRLTEHNLGKCRYTSGRRPWQIVFTETYSTRSDAMQREKFFKSGQGRKWLDENIKK